MSNGLRHLYARLADDPRFLAGHVALADLADALGVDECTAISVGLCEMPRSRDRETWLDLVAQRYGLDRDRLAQLLAKLGV